MTKNQNLHVIYPVSIWSRIQAKIAQESPRYLGAYRN